MSTRLRDLEKIVKEKINECVENLREMQEIEIQLQHSLGIVPHISESRGSDIDLWLLRWEVFRRGDLRLYTYLFTPFAEEFRDGMVVSRVVRVVKMMKSRGMEPEPPLHLINRRNLSKLKAYHEEHLQDEVDLLEEHVRKIQEEHRFLLINLDPPKSLSNL